MKGISSEIPVALLVDKNRRSLTHNLKKNLKIDSIGVGAVVVGFGHNSRDEVAGGERRICRGRQSGAEVIFPFSESGAAAGAVGSRKDRERR